MKAMLLGIFLSPLLLLTCTAPANDAKRPKPGTDPKVEFEHKPYRQSTVKAITKDSITLQVQEWTGQTGVRGPDGKWQWKTVTLPAEPPKRFELSDVLASGVVPDVPPRKGHFRTYRYRITDVRVGDWVNIYYSRIGGVDVCEYINIIKRPGGRIPPLPEGVEENPPSGIRYHEYWNAYWDLEDKGIPYPEKFGDQRRFPVAPPPRAVPVSVPVLTIPVPTRDELNQLAATYGPWTDPDKDCGFRLAGGQFKVTLPASEHLLGGRFPRVTNAPRAVREVEGDFIAVVRVVVPVPDWVPKGKWHFCSGGLVAWESDNQCFVHRLALGSVLNYREAIFADQQKLPTRQAFLGVPGKPTGTAFLRLKREGKKVTGGWSSDGKTWKEFEPQEMAWGAKVKVGVVAENSLWVPAEVTFDQYSLTQPKK